MNEKTIKRQKKIIIKKEERKKTLVNIESTISGIQEKGRFPFINNMCFFFHPVRQQIFLNSKSSLSLYKICCFGFFW